MMTMNCIAVCGFGNTGRAMLDYLLENESYTNIYLYNDETIADKDLRLHYEQRGVHFLIGPGQFPELGKCRTVILSPGFNGLTERFAELRARQCEIVAEIEFASRQIQAPIIAITGSNGKSTTTTLIHHLLQTAGVKAVLAGNIGIPLISQIRAIAAADWVVLELSSFQLEEIVHFRPRIALLLNITPDHLDRYPDMDEYIRAKLNVFRNQGPLDHLIVNHDDPLLCVRVGHLGQGQAWWFAREAGSGLSAWLHENELQLRLGPGEVETMTLARNPLKGLHNLENILAAVLAGRLTGLSMAAMEEGLSTFKGLAHRMESAGSVAGVEFINDSKATNVDAAKKSLGSIPAPLAIILGGKDKGSDFTLLLPELEPRATAIILLGKAAPEIARQLQSLENRFIWAKDMADAVEKGFTHLRSTGGTVLLAPACASFDMFNNYEHRGEVFGQAVKALRERTNHG